jgi:hypothetical protein
VPQHLHHRLRLQERLLPMASSVSLTSTAAAAAAAARDRAPFPAQVGTGLYPPQHRRQHPCPSLQLRQRSRHSLPSSTTLVLLPDCVDDRVALAHGGGPAPRGGAGPATPASVAALRPPRIRRRGEIDPSHPKPDRAGLGHRMLLKKKHLTSGARTSESGRRD